VSAAAALAAYPKTIVLADGAHLLLRPTSGVDAPGLAALLEGLDAEERWHVAGSAESGGFVVLALDGDRVAGAVRLARRGTPSARHVADVGVVLGAGYRGRRLGTWLLLDAVHLAEALGVERLVAEVPAAAADELAALRRLDFVLEATLPDRHRTAAGVAEPALVLAKSIHPEWTDF
jgi:L-amino acid N-acyltransferase YncA